ncbi:MAG: type II secretion system protein GspM [Candidatus Eiseniibacteriota bacterium]
MSPAMRRVLSRTAAVGLLLAVPALLYGAVVLPVRAYVGGLETEIAGLEDALGRYQRIAGERTQLAALVRHAAQQQPDTGLYLEGSSDALAAAQLQDLLNQIVKSSGGAVDSVRVLQSAAEGPNRRVSVQLLIETRVTALRAMLYSIETGKPYLFVKSITVNSIAGVRPDSPVEDSSDLDVRLEVYGYRKG